MRIFVTGGTGFIGSYFIRHALLAGHEIVPLRLPGTVPVIPLSDDLEWLEATLDHVPVDALRGCEALVHFAAQGVSPQPTDWNLAFEINVRQSLVLMAAAAEAGVSHLIACGSCFEYGLCGERYEFIPPDAPLEPIGPYAASKAAFSVALGAMARSSTCGFTMLRPFHLYGDGQHPSNFWPSLRAAALSGSDFLMTAGEQVRDFLPVEAVADAFLAALEVHPEPGAMEVRNLGSGNPITLREFATRWWQHWGAAGILKPGALPYRADEVMRFVPAIQ